MFKWALRYQKTYYLKDAYSFELTKQLKHAKLFSTKKDAEVWLWDLRQWNGRPVKVFLSLGELIELDSY